MNREAVPSRLITPGIYRKEIVRRPPDDLRTGVPAFLGFRPDGRGGDPVPVSRLADARRALRRSADGADGTTEEESGPGGLEAAVQGFFANGGRFCYLVPLERDDPPERALESGLDALERLEGAVDLICAPDLVSRAGSGEATSEVLGLQQAILTRCGPRTGWFALLDALVGADPEEVLEQRSGLRSPDGALYYPWLRTRSPADEVGDVGALVPPCGHVAGVLARVDRTTGVHKAPANEVLEGVVDLERPITNDIQDRLNPVGVNCIRSFPARGIRVWGARTLGGESEWRHVNVRRLVLSIGRRLERDLAPVTFEPHGPELWARVRSRVAECLTECYRSGALRGRTPREAFYVKCDRETNPDASKEGGRIVTEIGLAPNGPVEFIVVRLVQDASGVSLEEPSGPG